MAARQQEIKRTDLREHDLSVPGREVVQVRLDIGLGEPIKHKHPGEEIIYVLEGSSAKGVALLEVGGGLT